MACTSQKANTTPKRRKRKHACSSKNYDATHAKFYELWPKRTRQNEPAVHTIVADTTLNEKIFPDSNHDKEDVADTTLNEKIFPDSNHDKEDNRANSSLIFFSSESDYALSSEDELQSRTESPQTHLSFFSSGTGDESDTDKILGNFTVGRSVQSSTIMGSALAEDLLARLQPSLQLVEEKGGLSEALVDSFDYLCATEVDLVRLQAAEAEAARLDADEEEAACLKATRKQACEESVEQNTQLLENDVLKQFSNIDHAAADLSKWSYDSPNPLSSSACVWIEKPQGSSLNLKLREEDRFLPCIHFNGQKYQLGVSSTREEAAAKIASKYSKLYIELNCSSAFGIPPAEQAEAVVTVKRLGKHITADEATTVITTQELPLYWCSQTGSIGSNSAYAVRLNDAERASANLSKLKSDDAESGYRGVDCKVCGGFSALVKFKGDAHPVGVYRTAEEAATVLAVVCSKLRATLQSTQQQNSTENNRRSLLLQAALEPPATIDVPTSQHVWYRSASAL